MEGLSAVDLVATGDAATVLVTRYARTGSARFFNFKV
jgi:hypothetical protein